MEADGICRMRSALGPGTVPFNGCGEFRITSVVEPCSFLFLRSKFVKRRRATANFGMAGWQILSPIDILMNVLMTQSSNPVCKLRC